jgi:nucleoside-diphosphate-sugar epimerase
LNSLVVLGSTSFLGKVLLNTINSDVLIKAVVREIPIDAEKYTKRVQWIKVDAINTYSLNKILAKEDIVINLIYIRDDKMTTNIKLINNIIEACICSKVSRLIHCSTASVYGDISTHYINELTSCNPKTNYEKVKKSVEEVVLKAQTEGLDVGIIRPTAILGFGGKNLKKLTYSLISGNKFINYLRTCVLGTMPMHLVPARNVVGALIFLALYKKKLNGNIFIVSEDENINNNFKKVQEILIDELGLEHPIFPYIFLPRILQSILFKIINRSDLNIKRNYDSKKIIEYGFKPNDTIKEAIKQFLRSI